MGTLLHAGSEITISTDRNDAIYASGEMAVFTIEVKRNDKPLKFGHIHVVLGVKDGKKLVDRKVDLAEENPVRVSGTLLEPGFLLLTVNGLPDTKEVLAGAGFDPEKIVMGNAMPADFQKFWDDGREAVSDIPVQYEKLEAYSTADYTSYAVTVVVLHGEVLRGFLSIPNAPGPFPVWVQVPGAGPGVNAPPTEWAKRGVIALTMNVHKFPVALGNAEETKRIFEEHKTNPYYPLTNADNRETYHFRNVILGVDRAITDVASRVEWDRQHLVFDGSSQGGGLALMMAGFNPNISAVAANVPALSDHGGFRRGRQPGWPGLAALGEAAMEVSAYYDAANFAKFINCPALVSAAFVDTTCSPASVYAAFNEIKSVKKMLPQPMAGHAVTPEYTAVKNPWVKEQLGLPVNGEN